MFKLIHKFDGGRSVLCTDGKFHNEVMVGKVVCGRRVAVKLYKTNAGVAAAERTWNAALGDYAVREAA